MDMGINRPGVKVGAVSKREEGGCGPGGNEESRSGVWLAMNQAVYLASQQVADPVQEF